MKQEVAKVSSIVYQTSMQTCITYAYESVAHWDKKKQQSRATRSGLFRAEGAYLVKSTHFL